ncbi:MAG: hypothetical protein ACHQKZ_01245 [Solirubrobacterales bacterium]
MALCPACRRPVAMVRATCVYCGAALPAAAVEEAAKSAEAVLSAAAPAGPPEAPRFVLVVDLDSGTEEAVASALGLSPFEAGQRRKRGGLQFLRIAEEGEAQQTASVLREHGLFVEAVPEHEVRTPPLLATGGAQQGDALHLKLKDGPLVLRADDLMLLVRGPIAREYQPSLQIRRLQSASLEGGYLIHLHRPGDLRPVELDAGNFEFGFTLTGSSLLELLGWLEEVAPGVPVDDSFRRITPVLGPAAPPTSGVMAATAGLHRASRSSGLGNWTSRASSATKDEPPALLDNVAQFRFYSGWRAAVERRRS